MFIFSEHQKIWLNTSRKEVTWVGGEFFLYNPDSNTKDVYYDPKEWEAAAQSQRARGITPDDCGTGSAARVIEFFAQTRNAGRPGTPETWGSGSGGAAFFR